MFKGPWAFYRCHRKPNLSIRPERIYYSIKVTNNESTPARVGIKDRFGKLIWTDLPAGATWNPFQDLFFYIDTPEIVIDNNKSFFVLVPARDQRLGTGENRYATEVWNFSFSDSTDYTRRNDLNEQNHDLLWNADFKNKNPFAPAPKSYCVKTFLSMP